VVTADNGVVLFTGYAIAAPARLYAGMGTTGPAYVLELSCLSDEILLDARVSDKTIECVATSAGDLADEDYGTRHHTNDTDERRTRYSRASAVFNRWRQELVGECWAAGKRSPCLLSRCE